MSPPGLMKKKYWSFGKCTRFRMKRQAGSQSLPSLFMGKKFWKWRLRVCFRDRICFLQVRRQPAKIFWQKIWHIFFNRPTYNVSFHVNTNSGDLIGTDTFEDDQVKLRKGSIYRCAECGGFGVLDEINMAKNDAVSVLHATLDHRRSIDVPGYDKIDLHPAARFIGTMNYGYAGTKELNEALVSRFMVIDMPAQTEETLQFIFHQMFPTAKEHAIDQFIGVFLDLQLKAQNSEISTKALDLRGLLAAMKIVEVGLSPAKAIRMGVINKTFDIFEKEIVEDVVNTRIPLEWTREDVYE